MTSKNIELNALAKPDQKLSLLKLICKEFSVNEEWLMNGAEPMFIEPDTFSLDDFVRSQYLLSDYLLLRKHVPALSVAFLMILINSYHLTVQRILNWRSLKCTLN